MLQDFYEAVFSNLCGPSQFLAYPSADVCGNVNWLNIPCSLSLNIRQKRSGRLHLRSCVLGANFVRRRCPISFSRETEATQSVYLACSALDIDSFGMKVWP